MSKVSERSLSAAVRKSTVLVMYGAYGVACVLWVFAEGLRTLPIAISVVALLLLSLGALILLFQKTRYWKWGNSPDAELDEFQISSRNAAYKNAYIIVASVSLLVMFAARIGYDVTQITVTESAGEILFWGWFLLVLTLPAALLAWTEKPFDDDEDELGIARR
ncbi:MAG TPA: hypothetical protein VEZ70_00700 [Allosphingosinicella sp.]|jgi:hypothetical protein|nr:hypothetical protein [Allosphingosinicella sp.]